MNQAEHALQTKLKRLCAEQIDEPHKFIAYDRRQGAGRFTHARENARGMVTGHADVRIARHVGLPDPYIEIKVLPNKFDADGAQAKFGADMVVLGHYFGVAYNAAEFVAHLRAAGVRLRNTADWHAAEIDAKAPAPPKKRRASGPQKPRATAKGLRVGRMRYGI